MNRLTPLVITFAALCDGPLDPGSGQAGRRVSREPPDQQRKRNFAFRCARASIRPPPPKPQPLRPAPFLPKPK